jgi:hypothetical protein
MMAMTCGVGLVIAWLLYELGTELIACCSVRRFFQPFVCSHCRIAQGRPETRFAVADRLSRYRPSSGGGC